MLRDIDPISLITNGGGSSCIEGDGLAVEGWDGITSHGEGLGVRGLGSGC